MLKGARSVRVGLYFDLRNPQRWRQDPASLHAFTLELCEEADRLGIGSLWFTEHHKFDDGYLSQPLTFAAAVAARTTRARLGTAVLVAQLHHPVRLAEEAALVDLISNGGLDIGLGAGYRTTEYDVSGASLDRRFVSEHLEYQVNSYRRHMVEGTDQPVPRPVDVEKLRDREPRTSIDYFFLETPDRMAERVRAYTAGAPVETVFFWASIGGMSQERARDQVQLVCNKLAPLLAEPSAGPEDDQ